jgi:hypothetical protein
MILENHVSKSAEQSRSDRSSTAKERRALRALARQFTFLDQLRESGDTNMYGSAPYVMDAFGVNRDKASKIVRDWMRSFDGKSSAEERARAAIAKATGA